MYSVSADFFTEIQAEKRKVFAKAKIDYTDWEIDQSITITASEKIAVPASVQEFFLRQTADGISSASRKWVSLDGNSHPDGTWFPLPATVAANEQVGWWGTQLSGVDCSFTAPYPTLTVTHLPRPVHSLFVAGDEKRNEFPVNFIINLYDGNGTLLHSENVTGNTAVVWQKIFSSPVLNVAKQELIIQKWSHPGQQTKITEFFSIVQEEYLEGDLVEISLLEEREVEGASIPLGAISANEIKLKLRNEDRRFDPDNTSSPLFQLIKPNRRIRVWLGVMVWTPL